MENLITDSSLMTACDSIEAHSVGFPSVGRDVNFFLERVNSWKLFDFNIKKKETVKSSKREESS